MNLGQAILTAATRAVTDKINTCRVGILTQVDLPRLCNVLLKGLLQGQRSGSSRSIAVQGLPRRPSSSLRRWAISSSSRSPSRTSSSKLS